MREEPFICESPAQSFSWVPSISWVPPGLPQDPPFLSPSGMIRSPTAHWQARLLARKNPASHCARAMQPEADSRGSEERQIAPAASLMLERSCPWDWHWAHVQCWPACAATPTMWCLGAVPQASPQAAGQQLQLGERLLKRQASRESREQATVVTVAPAEREVEPQPSKNPVACDECQWALRC